MAAAALDPLRFPEAPFSPNGYDSLNDWYLLWAYHGRQRVRCAVPETLFEDQFDNEDAKKPSDEALNIIRAKFQRLAALSPELLKRRTADGFVDLRLTDQLFEAL